MSRLNLGVQQHLNRTPVNLPDLKRDIANGTAQRVTQLSVFGATESQKQQFYASIGKNDAVVSFDGAVLEIHDRSKLTDEFIHQQILDRNPALGRRPKFLPHTKGAAKARRQAYHQSDHESVAGKSWDAMVNGFRALMAGRNDMAVAGATSAATCALSSSMSKDPNTPHPLTNLAEAARGVSWITRHFTMAKALKNSPHEDRGVKMRPLERGDLATAFINLADRNYGSWAKNLVKRDGWHDMIMPSHAKRKAFAEAYIKHNGLFPKETEEFRTFVARRVAGKSQNYDEVGRFLETQHKEAFLHVAQQRYGPWAREHFQNLPYHKLHKPDAECLQNFAQAFIKNNDPSAIESGLSSGQLDLVNYNIALEAAKNAESYEDVARNLAAEWQAKGPGNADAAQDFDDALVETLESKSQDLRTWIDEFEQIDQGTENLTPDLRDAWTRARTADAKADQHEFFAALQQLNKLGVSPEEMLEQLGGGIQKLRGDLRQGFAKFLFECIDEKGSNQEKALLYQRYNQMHPDMVKKFDPYEAIICEILVQRMGEGQPLEMLDRIGNQLQLLRGLSKQRFTNLVFKLIDQAGSYRDKHELYVKYNRLDQDEVLNRDPQRRAGTELLLGRIREEGGNLVTSTRLLKLYDYFPDTLKDQSPQLHKQCVFASRFHVGKEAQLKAERLQAELEERNISQPIGPEGFLLDDEKDFTDPARVKADIRNRDVFGFQVSAAELRRYSEETLVGVLKEVTPEVAMEDCREVWDELARRGKSPEELAALRQEIAG